MLKKYLHIVGLSLASLVLSNKAYGNVSGDFLTEEQSQISLISGLFVLLVVMIMLLFRRYRRKRNSYKMQSKDPLYGDLWKTDNLTFTPTVFSSDSSPAILVAHHDNNLRLFLTNTLRLNYRVISTCEGEEAYEKAFEMVPDLIIANSVLPGIEGRVFCRRIKTSEVTSHIPVIMLGLEDAEENESWREYADDFLADAFDARELLMRVHNLISQRKRLQEEYRRQVRVEVKEARFPLPEQPFLFKLKRILKTYYSDPMFGVEQLTDQLQMNRLQLYRKLKAVTTYTPGDFLRFYRVEMAKRLLRQERISPTEAAVRCGFANVSGFNKAFRDFTGQTPVEYSMQSSRRGESILEE